MTTDTDLTDSLNKLLLETAEAFLRTAQQHHAGQIAGGEYEIHLAVRHRATAQPETVAA